MQFICAFSCYNMSEKWKWKRYSKKKLALQRPAEVIVIVKMHFVHIYGLKTVGSPCVLGQTGKWGQKPLPASSSLNMKEDILATLLAIRSFWITFFNLSITMLMKTGKGMQFQQWKLEMLVKNVSGKSWRVN